MLPETIAPIGPLARSNNPPLTAEDISHAICLDDDKSIKSITHRSILTKPIDQNKERDRSE